jgi:hypothetical protein
VPPADSPDEWLQSVDYWPPFTRKALYATELPVALTIGWYQHPLSLTQPQPLFPPSLLPGVDRLHLHARILVLEAVLIIAIASFWWLVGIGLRRWTGLARWIDAPVWVITFGGMICAVCSALQLGRAVAIIAMAFLLVVVLGWVVLLVISVAYTSVKSGTRLLRFFIPARQGR